jgi:hypothetical protein
MDGFSAAREPGQVETIIAKEMLARMNSTIRL